MLLWSNLWNCSKQITKVEHNGINQPEMFIELPQYSQLHSISNFWDSWSLSENVSFESNSKKLMKQNKCLQLNFSNIFCANCRYDPSFIHGTK